MRRDDQNDSGKGKMKRKFVELCRQDQDDDYYMMFLMIVLSILILIIDSPEGFNQLKLTIHTIWMQIDKVVSKFTWLEIIKAVSIVFCMAIHGGLIIFLWRETWHNIIKKWPIGFLIKISELITVSIEKETNDDPIDGIGFDEGTDTKNNETDKDEENQNNKSEAEKGTDKSTDENTTDDGEDEKKQDVKTNEKEVKSDSENNQNEKGTGKPTNENTTANDENQRVQSSKNKTLAEIFAILYMLMGCVIVLFAILNAVRLDKKILADKINAEVGWEELFNTEKFLGITFVHAVTVFGIVLSLAIALYLLRLVYIKIEKNSRKKGYYTAMVISFLPSGIIACIVLYNYFTSSTLMLGELEEWIEALMDFGSMVSILVIFIISSLTINIILVAFVDLMDSNGLEDEKESATNYLKNIFAALIDASMETVLFLLQFIADFVSNLYITSFDSLSEDDIKEMEKDHKLLDEDVAESIYSGYEGDMMLEKIKDYMKPKSEEGE